MYTNGLLPSLNRCDERRRPAELWPLRAFL